MGWEPCTIKNIKSYKPINKSISSGQVLHCPYNYNAAKLIIKEMADLLALDLVAQNIVTDQIVLNIEYDADSLKIRNVNQLLVDKIIEDKYGRKIPKPSHGTYNLEHKTSSSKLIRESMVKLYNEIVNPHLLIRKVTMVANNITIKNIEKDNKIIKQIDIFTDTKELTKQHELEKEEELKDDKIQNVILQIKNKYGKNSILKVMNLSKEGTTIERNKQIGGHKE